MSSIYEVILDPAEPYEEEGLTSPHAPLVLNQGTGPIEIDQAGIDWGEAAIQQYLAEQRYGQTPVGFRIPNRVVTVPLILGGGLNSAEEEEARKELQMKVGRLQAEGGILMRKRLLGGPMFADIVGASLTLPDKFGETGQVETGVVLKLECLPDFYGQLVTLDAIEGTGEARGVLKKAAVQAVIDGDYPARAKMVLTEQAKQTQKSLLYGCRSRHYSSAATAALAIDAKLMTPLNGAVEAVQALAYSGKWVRLASPEPETWHPMLSTDLLSGGPLTHLGVFRVIARVSGEGAPAQVRLAWSLDDATAPIYNAPATYNASSNMELLDLGEINIEEPPVGEHWWRGIVQVETGTVAHAIGIDRIWLQPVSDGAAGRLRATAQPASTLLRPIREPTVGEDSNAVHAGANPWENATNIQAGTAGQAGVQPGGGSSHALVGKGMGFAVSSEGTIKGIEVVLGEVQKSSTPELVVSMLKAGATAGTTKNLPGGSSAFGTFIFGGPSDLWGTTWTPAQINAANFGIAAWITGFSTQLQLVGTVTIRVYYSIGGGSVLEDAVLYSERLSQVSYDGAYREDTATGAYVRVSEETGELFRLPTSGLEGRAVELLVKNSRGLLGQTPDVGIDKIKAQVFYRPCFLGRI
jgi:hypothetical protein